MRRTTAAAMSASALIVGMIALHEGYRGEAYDDGVGIQTIGFGSTAGVKRGDRTDPVRAVQRLAADATRVSQAVARCVGEVPLYQHEFDAYVSLTYNIGVNAFCGSTLVKKLRSTPPGYAEACREILRWNKAGGRVQNGLVRRREAEYALCVGTAQGG